MIVIYSIASYLLSLLMPDYVYADAYQTSSAAGWFGFLDPNKIVTVAGAVALSVLTMIGVRRKRKKAEKSKEVYRNRYQSQESGKTYFISNKFPGSQSRAAKKVKWILEDAYKAVVGQYETSMKKSVMDIHYDCETARLEFERDIYKEALKQAMGENSLSEYEMERFQDFLRSRCIDPGKVGSAYIVLLAFWLRKKIVTDDLKAAKILNADVVHHFNKCYYEAMKDGCRGQTSLNIKSVAAHYWHARILSEISLNETAIHQLSAMGILKGNEEREKLFAKKALEIELAEYEPFMRKYMQTGVMEKNCYETNEQIDALIDSIDISLYDAKEIMKELLI